MVTGEAAVYQYATNRHSAAKCDLKCELTKTEQTVGSARRLFQYWKFRCFAECWELFAVFQIFIYTDCWLWTSRHVWGWIVFCLADRLTNICCLMVLLHSNHTLFNVLFNIILRTTLLCDAFDRPWCCYLCRGSAKHVFAVREFIDTLCLTWTRDGYVVFASLYVWYPRFGIRVSDVQRIKDIDLFWLFV